MQALAKKWIALAKKGNATALASILERLDPIPKDDPSAGRIVLEGLKLELTPGGATVTTMRSTTTPTGESDARSEREESYGGGADAQSSHVEALQGAPLPVMESFEGLGVSQPESVGGLGGGGAAAECPGGAANGGT